MAVHKFARILRDGGSIPMFGDGTTSRDYTYVDDTVSGVLGALRWVEPGDGRYGVFNLGNHRTVTLSDMIRIIGEEMGIEPRIEQLSMQPGDVLRTYADISLARDELDYRPDTEFRDGVRRFLEWFARQPVHTA